jgi:ribosomal-protein-alanine N-acetyltransferase
MYWLRNISWLNRTPRFTLRPYRKSDLPSMVKHINDKAIARYILTIPYPYTMKDAEKWYREITRIQKTDSTVLAIIIDGEAAGAIRFTRHNHKAEIGYWLGRAYRDKGIMTEVVKEITEYGFNELGLRRMHATAMTSNKASIRVLEKAGYKLEALLRGNAIKGNKLIKHYLFAKVK